MGKTREDYTKIITDLKAKKYKPIYFLQGEETFYIDKISDYIENNVLSETERDFNLTVRHGKDQMRETGAQGGTMTRKLEYKDILNDMLRQPMMAERQVVILKEAQGFDEMDSLLSYFEAPNEKTIFVVCYKHKKVRMNSKIAKAVIKNGVIFTADKVREWDIPKWIVGYVNKKGFEISPANAQMLSEYLGDELAKITNELDKFDIILKKGDAITSEIIEKYIGISKNYNVFELQKAIVSKDAEKANRIINYYIANPKSTPFQLLTGVLYSFFSKVYMMYSLRGKSQQAKFKALKTGSDFVIRQYDQAAKNFSKTKVESIISLLHKYDMMSKGVGYSTTQKNINELLKEFVWQVLSA